MAKKVKYVLNIFSGKFDAVLDIDAVENQIIEGLDINGSSVVNQPCRIDPDNDNGVLTETDNKEVSWPVGVFGLVIAKPTATTANVLLAGTATGLSGLTRGLKIYISGTGFLTQTAPVGGGPDKLWSQAIGVATTATKANISLEDGTVKP